MDYDLTPLIEKYGFDLDRIDEGQYGQLFSIDPQAVSCLFHLRLMIISSFYNKTIF